MHKHARVLFLALLAALPFTSVGAQDRAPVQMGTFKRSLGRSPAFRDWVAAVGSFAGWEGCDSQKAKHNLVRVHGVAWSPNGVVVALPRRARTVDNDPYIISARLEFDHGEMTPWDNHGLDLPDTIRLWVWVGRAPARFQVSCGTRIRNREGERRWGGITSVIPAGMYTPSSGTRAQYRPWQTRNDPGVLIGGVYVDNNRPIRAFRVDRDREACQPLVP